MDGNTDADVKVESSTNDAGKHQDDDKRDGQGGERFSGRGRGGRGRGGERRGGFEGRRGGGRWGNSNRGGGGGGGGDRGQRGGGGDDQNDDNHEGHGGGREGGFQGGREGGFQGGREGGFQGGRGHRGDGQRGGGGRFGMRGPEDKLMEKLQQMMGPTFDLPAVETTEKKFNGRNRLYIGNIGNEVTEEDIIELFKKYGETAEPFLNKEKNFGFIKLDYHSNAEKARRELDGTMLKQRNLKIRFAPNSATVKVKNLSQYVTNELLYHAFSIFGEIERCVVTVDERGRPTGEAIIDFARKGSAMHAIRKCSEGCFFLTSSLLPCIVETHEHVDDTEGYSDKNIIKKTHEFHRERETGPRFASPGSFEHEYGMRWKQLFDLFTQKQEALKKELELEKEKLVAQMEYARYEHETEMLRDQLRAREQDKERQKREWEMKQRQVEEERLRTEEMMRRKQEEMESRMTKQKDDMRRRQQENTLFMQAHNLDSLLEQQEQVFDQPTGYSDGNLDDTNMDPKTFMSSYERRPSRFESRGDAGVRGNQDQQANRGGGGGHWISDNRADEYPNKRRRF